MKWNSGNSFVEVKTFLLCLFVLGNINNIQGQCDECPKPNLAVYNMDVRVPMPEGHTDEILEKQKKWFNLRFENEMFWGEIVNNDPTYLCFHQTDPHAINRGDTMLITFITVPPAGGEIPWPCDYLIHGWVAGSEGNYIVTHRVETAYSREVVHSASKTFTSLLGYPLANSYSMQIAREEFIPLFDLIRKFEKEKRDNNRDVNIYIDKFSVAPEKNKVKKGEDVEVEFKLVDCDGEPLSGREVLLQGGSFGGSSLARSTKGRFTNTTTVTNEEGVAKATFKAGVSPGKAVLRTYHKYFKPSGEEYCAYGEAEIEIKKDRREKFLGKMEATVITHTASPNFREPVEEKEAESIYFSFMEMGSSPGSIENLNKPEFRANIFETNVQYPVFWGITTRNDFGEPNKVKTTIKTKTYDEQFGEFQLFYEETLEGESNGYDWNFTVNPYARQSTGFQSIDGKTQYCVKLYMTGNIRLHGDAKYKTTGRVNGRKRIDVDKFENFSETIDEDSYLGVAQCDCEKQEQNEDKYVLPLIIQTPQRFEEFLLDPEGTFVLNLSGRWYSNGDGTEESETTMNVKISLTPID